ncbi:hypothetical protein HKD37_18G051301 [Glycine soja]
MLLIVYLTEADESCSLEQWWHDDLNMPLGSYWKSSPLAHCFQQREGFNSDGKETCVMTTVRQAIILHMKSQNQNISPVTQIGGHMGPVLECMCFQQGNQYPIIIVTIVSNVFSNSTNTHMVQFTRILGP